MSKINIRFGATPGEESAALQELSIARAKPDGTTFPSLRGRLDALDASLAESTQLKGTTQSITFNTDGTVQKVQHKDSGNVVLREDVFTYSTNLITEVRTLSSGGSVTFKYHLDTLETEVI
jgi:hypothetical protein